MGFLARFTRRHLFGLLGGAASIALAEIARAQTTDGCEIGFVNGLLTIGGAECEVLQAGGAQVAAPSHLAGEVVTQEQDATTASSTTDRATQEEIQQRRRDHKQRKKDNKRSQKRDKRNRAENRHERNRNAKTSCDDFSDQKEAIEWLAQFPEDADLIDPDGDGLACEHLDQVRCNDFSNEEEAQAWVDQFGFTPQDDPFNLFKQNDLTPCKGFYV